MKTIILLAVLVVCGCSKAPCYPYLDLREEAERRQSFIDECRAMTGCIVTAEDLRQAANAKAMAVTHCKRVRIVEE